LIATIKRAGNTADGTLAVRPIPYLSVRRAQGLEEAVRTSIEALKFNIESPHIDINDIPQ
jgi:hypothetical protein